MFESGLRRLKNRIKTGLWHLTECIPFLSEDLPDNFLMTPRDLWSGDAEKARFLLHHGVFSLHEDRLELHNADWLPAGVHPVWYAYIHGFSWLRDLRALGSHQARLGARAMMQNWMDSFETYDRFVWGADVMGARLTQWITHYPFFGESAGDDFQARFFSCVLRQAKYLAAQDRVSIHVAQGLIGAGLALEGREAWLEKGLNMLQTVLDRDVLADGGHVSRSPRGLVDMTRHVVEIRAALTQAGYPWPSSMQDVLEKMVHAMRFFRHGDRSLALFHGTQEGDETCLKDLIDKTQVRAKMPASLPETGFERMAMNRSLLIMDCGRSPIFPHDRTAHAAPLAFEFSYGRDRVFVNCGTHLTQDAWQDALRFTPAHNALTIDHRNICEIHADQSLARKPRRVASKRTERKDSILVEAFHDGYVPLNGIIHHRRLYMCDQGRDVRGEETLVCDTGLGKTHQVHVRFHVHPRVQVSLVKGGAGALLRLPSGIGFRFTAEGAALALDESVYLGRGTQPRKTKQIVLSAKMQTDQYQIKWSMQKA